MLYQALERFVHLTTLFSGARHSASTEKPPTKCFYHNLQQRIREQAMHRSIVSSPEYQYRPLSSVNNEIRFLRIRPARSIESPLLIEIFAASLDEKPDYDALSYVWGQPDRKNGILCSNGTIIRINKHLFLSLHELRQNSCKGSVGGPDMHQSSRRPRAKSTSFNDEAYLQAGHPCCGRPGSLLPKSKTSVLSTGLVNPEPHPGADPKNTISHSTRSCSTCAHEFSKFWIPPLSHRSWRMFRQLRAKTWGFQILDYSGGCCLFYHTGYLQQTALPVG